MPDLVVLAAGMSTRYGALKQLEPLGPHGEALLHYALYDAWRAGFSRVVLVIRPELEQAFRDRVVEAAEGGALELRFAYQAVPRGRRKPWGTGHAVLAASAELDGPFGVLNADDFYGADAYRRMADHLESGEGTAGVVGYRLTDTLAVGGGVSRALLRVDADGRVTGVRELRELVAAPDGVRGVDVHGRPRRLKGNELVSTNFWGFPLAALGELGTRFRTFHDAHPGPQQEFLLSEAVDRLIRDGSLAVRLVDGGAGFFGVTRRADTEAVRRALAGLHAAGLYPGDLAAALAAGG